MFTQGINLGIYLGNSQNLFRTILVVQNLGVGSNPDARVFQKLRKAQITLRVGGSEYIKNVRNSKQGTNSSYILRVFLFTVKHF